VFGAFILGLAVAGIVVGDGVSAFGGSGSSTADTSDTGNADGAAVPTLTDATTTPSGDGTGSTRPGASDPPSATSSPPPLATPPDPSTLGATPAASPTAAVRGFLTAEAAGDLERAYRFLSPAEQEEFRTAQGYVAAHPDLLPPVTAFELPAANGAQSAPPAGPSGNASPSEGTNRIVRARVGFEPGLNKVSGLAPARAEVAWKTVATEEGWTVALTDSRIDPVYPPESGARDAAQRWARARADCEHAAEWDNGGLVGSPELSEQLCDASEPPHVGEPTELGRIDAQEFVSAFGGRVGDWARLVPISGPAEMRVVLAPIGWDWRVIGVISARGAPDATPPEDLPTSG